jgi:hypothetical protein
MGVKYDKDYSEIITDLIDVIPEIDNFYHFFGMDNKTWNNLDQQEQKECIKTLADDIFYALGTNPVQEIGEGIIKYDQQNHKIKVITGETYIQIINLT